MYKIILFLYLDFRGYTIRKKFGSELEQKFKDILNKYDKKSEAREALINEGVSKEDAILIVHRWYKREIYNQRKSIIDPIHPKLRQAELIQFSQNVKNIKYLYSCNYFLMNLIF